MQPRSGRHGPAPSRPRVVLPLPISHLTPRRSSRRVRPSRRGRRRLAPSADVEPARHKCAFCPRPALSPGEGRTARTTPPVDRNPRYRPVGRRGASFYRTWRGGIAEPRAWACPITRRMSHPDVAPIAAAGAPPAALRRVRFDHARTAVSHRPSANLGSPRPRGWRRSSTSGPMRDFSAKTAAGRSTGLAA